MSGPGPRDGDRGFHALVAVGTIAAVVVLAVAFSAPVPAQREVHSIPDRFAEIVLQERWDGTVGMAGAEDEDEGAKAKGEEGKAGRAEARGVALAYRRKDDSGSEAVAAAELSKQILESSGLLAELHAAGAGDAHFGDGSLSIGGEAFVAGVIGSQYGNQYGSGGLGARGSGVIGRPAALLTGEGGGRGEMNLNDLDLGHAGYGDGLAGLGMRRKGGAGRRTHLGRRAGAALSIGDPIILGALDKSVIERVIAQHQSQLRYCYQKELNKQPGLGGTVVTKFVIAPDGNVTRAATKHTSLDHSVVEDCLAGRFERMKFPSPKGGGIVIVEYPLEFGGGPAAPASPDEPRQDELPPLVVAETRTFLGDNPLDHSPPVQSFLARYSALDDLTFRDPRGYWANTYVPGDPTLRLLSNRLQEFDRADLHGLDWAQPHMDDLAQQGSQPFDPPDNAALAVYLHASEPGAEDRTRMVVQVGLQGTQRHAGRRPTMNVAVVLDVHPGLSESDGACMRAVLEALARERDIADRFSVVVAGRPGGVIVAPGEFRYGPLTVAGRQLFGDGDPAEGPTLDLAEAFAAAVAEVGGDEVSPLGSNAVLLVTARALDAEVDGLQAAVHAAAVEGFPTSVVGVGGGVLGWQLDRLVLAGQGNRRLMDRPDEAVELVQRELTAVGETVARAVRLRIRLAPGVELVDVLGSIPLDELAAQQVRDAEQSIDQRVAKDLGIVADRGDDEDGIQMVIPAFYSGDSHVILLDVVVPGPGPVADVTVRYKDLVHLRNGVTRDTLDLGRERVAAGPLERNVTRNVLSYELSGILRRASVTLEAGDVPGAVGLLRGHLDLLEAFHDEVPGYLGDPDLLADIAMLDEYLRALPPEPARATPGNTHLIASLRMAGRLKVLPRPRWD